MSMPCLVSRRAAISVLSVIALTFAGAPEVSAQAKTGTGDIRYEDGALYKGEYAVAVSGSLNQNQRRYPHGTGTMAWPDGARFQGTFDNGKPRQGTYFWNAKEWCAGRVTEGYVFDSLAGCEYADGTQYKGQMRDSRPNGQGEMLWPSGNRFEGTFAAGKPVKGSYKSKGGALCQGPMNAKYQIEGSGHCVYGSGARYDGAFKGGVRHGKGKIRFASGASYAGAWKNGKQHGKGAYAWPDGARFDGTFKDGTPVEGSYHAKGGTVCKGPMNPDYQVNGKGACDYGAGTRYEGAFKDGAHHGKGKILFSNGASYDGAWKNGVQHGKGAYVWPDGSRFTGTFEDDKPVAGTYKDKNGTVCEGPMTAGYQVDGAGKCTYDTGTRYEGAFKDGEHHGKGKMRFPSGETYDGDWVRGKFQGRGEFVWSDGTRFKGAFADDQPNGIGVFASGGDKNKTVCVEMRKGEIAENLDDARCKDLK